MKKLSEKTKQILEAQYAKERELLVAELFGDSSEAIAEYEMMVKEMDANDKLLKRWSYRFGPMLEHYPHRD